MELLGEYRDAGYAERAFLARRADGQMVRLSRLLYLVLCELDGKRDLAAIAATVGQEYGRKLNLKDLRFLLDQRLGPAGLLAGRAALLPRRVSPIMGLSSRRAVIAPAGVELLARVFAPLFSSPVPFVALASLLVLDGWLFIGNRLSRALVLIGRQPEMLLVLALLAVLATAFHECGHAAGLRYGGARPGAIGVGIYLIWPAFYTDLTDAYRLDRRGRLRADLGGVYFNALFGVGAMLVFLLSGYAPLLVIAFLQHLEIATQLLPLLRLDGHYILSDLTGVPDILAQVAPTLRGLVSRSPGSTKLNPSARRIVLTYVMVTVPVLIVGLSFSLVNLPHLLASAVRTASTDLPMGWQRLSGGHFIPGSLGLGRGLLSLIPILGVIITAARLLVRARTRIGRDLRRLRLNGSSRRHP